MNRDQAVEFIQSVHVGYLATQDAEGGASVRPMGIHTIYGDNIYFFTYAAAPKVAEMAKTPQVAVVWTELPSNSQVRIKGTARVESDEEVIARFKSDNPMVKQMEAAGPGFEFVLYRLEPTLVQAAQGLVPYTPVEW